MGVAKHLCEAYRQFGNENGKAIYRRGIELGNFRPEEIHLRELAELQWGENWHLGMLRYRESRAWMRESHDPITPDIFSPIVSQVIEDRVEEKFKLATQITDQLFDIIPNSSKTLGPIRKKIPGTTTESADQILPGMPYPRTGLNVAYSDIPEPSKQGLSIYIAEETLYENDTQFVLDSADDVAEYLGRWVEKERLKVVYGITGNYNLNGTTFNTYLTAGVYINSRDDLDIVDDITGDQALRLFDGMRHPLRNDEPIVIEPSAILHHRSKKITVANVFYPDTITQQTQSGVTVDRPSTMPKLTAHTTPYQDVLLAAAGLNQAQRESTILIGDFKGAFAWREVYPIETYKANAAATDLTPSGPLGERDIVFAMKSRVYGKAYVKNPRKVLRIRKMA